MYTVNRDPEPWVTLDENGKEFRTHTAHEDGLDENGVMWNGWTYDPRDEFDEQVHPLWSDPEPWVTIDDDGSEYRRHFKVGMEDSPAWEFSPRSEDEYNNA
jgi:hypothetical protein